MMRMWVSAAVCATALLASAACRGSASTAEDVRAASAALFETHWTIESIDGQPVIPGEGAQEPHVILRAKERAYVGSTGVNRFFGSYETSGPASITMRPGGMTMMAGPDELMRQEQRVLTRFEQIDGYRVDGDRLTLSAQGQDVMVLRASAPK